jgi:hypothetical protein
MVTHFAVVHSFRCDAECDSCYKDLLLFVMTAVEEYYYLYVSVDCACINFNGNDLHISPVKNILCLLAYKESL